MTLESVGRVWKFGEKVARRLEMALLCVLSLLFVLPVASSGADQGLLLAQAENPGEQPAASTGSSNKWLSNGSELGEWWEQSALDQNPMPKAILYHIEASYNFSKMTGNTKMDNHIINTALHLRKDRFTYEFTYNVNDSESTQGDYTIKTKDKSWSHNLFIDLTQELYALVSFEWEHSQSRQIEDKYIYFLGAGMKMPLKNGGTLDLFCGGGKEEEETMAEPGKTTDTTILHLEQSLNLPLSERLSFDESLQASLDVDDNDNYEGTLNLSLNYQIFDPLSLNATYMVKYDNAPVEGVKDTDTSLTMGVQLSFWNL